MGKIKIVNLSVIIRCNITLSSLQPLVETLECQLIEWIFSYSMCVCILFCMLCEVSMSYLHILSEGPFSWKASVQNCTSLLQLFRSFSFLASGFFPFTFSLPTGGGKDRHQVSAVNDNILYLLVWLSNYVEYDYSLHVSLVYDYQIHACTSLS